ncbi:polyprenyl synthetase family protein [Kocuria sp. CNJ-770]|uniref:polyprenyl synthetase family protein n=1 Tax=Kocuria sp. CNJ-770 TaxID=1904964 RepID=UPI000AB7C2EE|nr:polyprenyl synthetase family protein [Kocuria sp. CNJ-770]
MEWGNGDGLLARIGILERPSGHRGRHRPGRRGASAVPALDRFLTESTGRAGGVDPGFAQLWEEVARLSTGGKRIRPRLVRLAADAYPQREPAPVVEAVGAAFELLHTALIVHDDVIDQDEQRRHQPTINAAAAARASAAGSAPEQARQYGASVGVIAGDLALAGAYRLVARSGLSPERLPRLLELLDEALFSSAAGELLDVDHALPGARPEREQILAATCLKTAVYSFETPLQAGGVLGGAPEEHVAVLGRLGRTVGTAYQLVDDLLGVFGDPEATGKSAVSDLREGKRTMLVLAAQCTSDGEELDALLGRPDLGDEEAARARELIERCGARQEVEDMVAGCAAEARALLEAAGLPETLDQELRRIVGGATERIR